MSEATTSAFVGPRNRLFVRDMHAIGHVAKQAVSAGKSALIWSEGQVMYWAFVETQDWLLWVTGPFSSLTMIEITRHTGTSSTVLSVTVLGESHVQKRVKPR
jgi:hypothetical protein